MVGLEQATRRGGEPATAHRAFWWERARPVDAHVVPLRAVIFDLDSAMAEIDEDGDQVARTGLIDVVMSLFVAGVWVGVVSTGRRAEVEPLVRELVGDGLVDTIVTIDDLPDCADSAADLYNLALWEFGIQPDGAMAVVGSGTALRTAVDCGLATIVMSSGAAGGQDLGAAAAVLADYDGADPLSASSCQRLHRLWWSASRQAA